MLRDFGLTHVMVEVHRVSRSVPSVPAVPLRNSRWSGCTVVARRHGMRRRLPTSVERGFGISIRKRSWSRGCR